MVAYKSREDEKASKWENDFDIEDIVYLYVEPERVWKVDAIEINPNGLLYKCHTCLDGEVFIELFFATQITRQKPIL